MQSVEGNYVDVVTRAVFHARVDLSDGTIDSVARLGPEDSSYGYLIPGFVDSHVHVESSMMLPREFGRLMLSRGVLAVVADPHEIANVLGVAGVRWMIADSKNTACKINYSAPSCVPASSFESSGATLDAEAVEALLSLPEVVSLAEVMAFPLVISREEGLMAKIAAAKRLNKVVDGHAPELRGSDLESYVTAGITADHETVSIEEGQEKISLGMKVQIREGSAAKNFEDLHPLISEHPTMTMFCTDDSHPDRPGSINHLVRRSVELGHNVFDVLRVSSWNAVNHYGLNLGQLQIGDSADFVIVKDLTSFDILESWIEGKREFTSDDPMSRDTPFVAPPDLPNRFECDLRTLSDLAFTLPHPERRMWVMECTDGSLLTRRLEVFVPMNEEQNVESDVDQDVLKMTVISRYEPSKKAALGFVKGFQLKNGALASSVAHDSHNIIAVGCSDEELLRAVNLVIQNQGAIVCVSGETELVMPLPVAGLMSDLPGNEVAALYSQLDYFAREEMGCVLSAPFMTLSFLALLVIPTLKLSDWGLFDGLRFRLVKWRETDGEEEITE